MKCRECTSLNVTAYEFTLNDNITKLLSAMIKHGKRDVDMFWIRQQGYGNMTSIAKYFGLIQESGGRDRHWSLTATGEAFVKGEKIPIWVRVFEGEVYEKSQTLIGFEETVKASPYIKVDPPDWLLEQRREKHFRQNSLL